MTDRFECNTAYQNTQKIIRLHETPTDSSPILSPLAAAEVVAASARFLEEPTGINRLECPFFGTGEEAGLCKPPFTINEGLKPCKFADRSGLVNVPLTTTPPNFPGSLNRR